MLELLSNELLFSILLHLDDRGLDNFAATSEHHQLLVNSIEAHGQEMAIRALGNVGLALDPYLLRTNKFIGIKFLQFQGMLLEFPFTTKFVCRCEVRIELTLCVQSRTLQNRFTHGTSMQLLLLHASLRAQPSIYHGSTSFVMEYETS
jgi:hypothetical protein